MMKINDNLDRILKERKTNVHKLSRGAGVNHENVYKILKDKNKILEYIQ